MNAIIRKIDELGRIVIPYDMRKVLSIISGDELSFVCDGKSICITKHRDERFCNCCNQTKKILTSVKNIKLCEQCMDENKNG